MERGRQFEIGIIEELREKAAAFEFEIEDTGNKGKGDGKTHDLLLIDKSGRRYIGEIKSPVARCGECDLRYDENGKLYVSPRAKTWNNNFQPFLDDFNATTSIFDIIGHNYPLAGEQDKVAAAYFANVDYLFTRKGGKMYVVPHDRILSSITFKGSEIRSCGKNTAKVFTPIHCYMQFSSCCVRQDDKNYWVRRNVLENRNENSRFFSFAACPIYKVEKNKVAAEGDIIRIPKTAIKQTTSNISIHMEVI